MSCLPRLALLAALAVAPFLAPTSASAAPLAVAPMLSAALAEADTGLLMEVQSRRRCRIVIVNRRDRFGRPVQVRRQVCRNVRYRY